MRHFTVAFTWEFENVLLIFTLTMFSEIEWKLEERASVTWCVKDWALLSILRQDYVWWGIVCTQFFERNWNVRNRNFNGRRWTIWKNSHKCYPWKWIDVTQSSAQRAFLEYQRHCWCCWFIICCQAGKPKVVWHVSVIFVPILVTSNHKEQGVEACQCIYPSCYASLISSIIQSDKSWVYE